LQETDVRASHSPRLSRPGRHGRRPGDDRAVVRLPREADRFLTFISRLLGLARESIAANYFGASPVYAAFQFAFTVPNLFRKLLGEGALSAAFIPLYAQAVKTKPRDEANDLRRHQRQPAVRDPAGPDDRGRDRAAGRRHVRADAVGLPAGREAHDDHVAVRDARVRHRRSSARSCRVHERFAAITFTAVISNVCLIVAMVAAAKTLA
jgi:hypothetical protein